MRNICVLFGAGAEYCFNISGGVNFASKVLGIGTTEMDEAIEEYFRNNVSSFAHHDWYPKYGKYSWKYEHLVEAAVRKRLMDNNYQTKKEYDDDVKEKVSDLLKPENEVKRNKILEENSSYMGLIDEQFHTIISPRVLGPQKFWNVIECYTRAYLLIIGEMIAKEGISELTKEDYLKILQNPKESFDKALNFCNKQKSKKSYYSILANEENPNIKVITTNYTPLCREISGLCDEKIAAIHGKLNWFESPYNLQIYDICREQLPNELCFPYMFIQSGIKPIVDAIQINEYAKMLQFLRESERLMIVGYRLNSDDNHINGIIREYSNHKEVIYLDYDETTTEEGVLRRLRMDSATNLKMHMMYLKNICPKRMKFQIMQSKKSTQTGGFLRNLLMIFNFSQTVFRNRYRSAFPRGRILRRRRIFSCF